MYEDLFLVYSIFFRLRIEEFLGRKNNIICMFLGHKNNKSEEEKITKSEWKILSDGFKYKEHDSICMRCSNFTTLYVYEKWGNEVITVNRST